MSETKFVGIIVDGHRSYCDKNEQKDSHYKSQVTGSVKNRLHHSLLFILNIITTKFPEIFHRNLSLFIALSLELWNPKHHQTLDLTRASRSPVGLWLKGCRSDPTTAGRPVKRASSSSPAERNDTWEIKKWAESKLSNGWMWPDMKMRSEDVESDCTTVLIRSYTVPLLPCRSCRYHVAYTNLICFIILMIFKASEDGLVLDSTLLG